MQQINSFQFFQLGHVIHPLTELRPGVPLKEYQFPLVWARHSLRRFLTDQIIPTTICKPAAYRLISAIDELYPDQQEDRASLDIERPLVFPDIYDVTRTAGEFETVLSAELQNMATYFVSKKGIFDTNDLISRADEVFAPPIRAHLGDRVKRDLREAGKCLAFDLGTAAGFHTARAVEGVLLDYLSVVAGTAIEGLRPGEMNLGGYLRVLSANGGEPKIIATLDQFRDLHRNPLMHPEAELSIDDAVGLFNIAQSAIIAMVADKQTRNSPQASSRLPIEALRSG